MNGTDGKIFGREAQTQYAAMAQLRWRVFVNGLRSVHGLLDLGATGVSWLIYSLFGLGFGTGLFAAAHSLTSRASWQYLPILFWATSFLWLIFPIAVASFQEQSDLGMLLRFPVSFGSYFVLHLISVPMDASTFVGALCCLGLWSGIVMARPSLYLWAAISLAVLALFNILLTRAVFAWIDRWLAQRKTREILGAVFMVLFVSLLVINSLLNQNRHGPSSKSHQDEAPQIRELQAKYGPFLKTANQVQQWLPPGLSARALQKTIQQKTAAGVVSLSILALWLVLPGGAWAGRLKAQYRGQNLSWAPKRGRSIERGSGWTLGGSHPVAAVVEKELRTLLRSVPLLWAVSMPPLFVLVLAGVIHHSSSDMKFFPFAFPLCLAYALLGFTGLFYNLLGTEGAGIQMLFLSPTPVRTVLLGKNLLHSVLYALVGMIAAALSCLRLGVPPPAVLADTGAWLVFALPCNLAAGIIFSLAVPYRVNPGRIARPAGAQANTLPATLIQLGVLGVGAAVFWLCWSLKDLWLPVPILLALAAGAFFAWTRVLHYSDDNANRYRESLIATLMKAE